MAKTYQGLDADPGTSDSKVPVAVTPTGAVDGQSNPLQSQVVTLDIGDGTTPQPAGTANPLPVSATALPLPTGAATEATLASVLTDLAAVLATLQGTLAVSLSDAVAITGDVAVTGPLTDAELRATAVPISADALPLPTGAATQATLAEVLAALSETLTATITGSVEVTNDSGNALSVSAAALPLPDGAATDATAASILAALEAGVSIAGDVAISGTVPVSIASLPLPTGASTESTLSAIDTKLAGTLTVGTHAVSQSGSWTIALTAGTASIGVLGVNSGVDIGDVTINNGTGAAAVPIQDGGNSITVDATSLPLPTGAATETTLAAVNTKLGGSLTVATHAVTQSGTWNIGSITTLPALPAGTNQIGGVSSADRTDTIYNGTTALTPKFAKIAASASGNNTVVAAVTGKKIRVLALKLISNGTVNAKWQTGAGGTDLTGLSYFVANAGEVLPYNPAGWFETTSSTLLNLNLSAAIAVGGHLTYVEV